LSGAGPLGPLLADPTVTDVLVNCGAVWVDRGGGGLRRVPGLLGDAVEVRNLAKRLASNAGRRLDDASPFVDVRLPDGTTKNFTCLKLEDKYGGMLSPLNDECAMVYYPPAAHILNMTLESASGEFPTAYDNFLANGHPEEHDRARWTVQALKEFYPELSGCEILGTYLKVAINSVSDSRVRRNLGVYGVLPACTMTVLPKWTMCVTNVKREMDLVLNHSCNMGNLEPDEAAQLREDANDYRLMPPEEWVNEPELLLRVALQHAANMRVPEAAARPMQSLATY